MALRKRPFIHVFVAAAPLWVVFSSIGGAAGELSSELRRQITDAGMAPWSGRQVSLDDTLRGPNREQVSLRQFIGTPILAYNYAQW